MTGGVLILIRYSINSGRERCVNCRNSGVSWCVESPSKDNFKVLKVKGPLRVALCRLRFCKYYLLARDANFEKIYSLTYPLSSSPVIETEARAFSKTVLCYVDWLKLQGRNKNSTNCLDKFDLCITSYERSLGFGNECMVGFLVPRAPDLAVWGFRDKGLCQQASYVAFADTHIVPNTQGCSSLHAVVQS